VRGVTTTLLWDDGPGEIRSGRVENTVLTEFRITRPPSPDQPLAAVGEHYTARLLGRIGNGRALARIGFGEDVIVQPAPNLPEGALFAAEMTRSPLAEPGRWKRAIIRPLDAVPATEPGRVHSTASWQTALLKAAQGASGIICGQSSAESRVKSALGSACPPIQIDPARIEEADFEGLIEQAVSGDFPIAGGALSFERTRAMLMIDVDGDGDARALNLAAAAEIPRLLRLLDCGGPVGIDFVSMQTKADRAAVDAALGTACTSLGQHERTALNGFGFCQIIRPRFGPSVPELLCGTTVGRLSLESRAVALLRAAARSIGFGARQLIAQPVLIDRLSAMPQEIAALRLFLGTEIELVPDSSATGYGSVHVAPR
jgi:ribonuclease G